MFMFPFWSTDICEYFSKGCYAVNSSAKCSARDVEDNMLNEGSLVKHTRITAFQ